MNRIGQQRRQNGPDLMALSSNSKVLARAASWSLTGQVGYYGFQWINMILLARLAGPEALGLYTLGLAIANPVMAFASLMFRLVYVTEQSGRWAFGDYSRIRWMTLPLGLIVILALGFGLGYRDTALIAILLAASWKMAEMLSDINYAVPNKKGDMRAIALSMITRAALSTGILASALYLTNNLIVSLLLFSVSWWLCFAVIDRPLVRETRKDVSTASKRALVMLALPLAASTGLVYLTNSIPRIVLDQFESTELLGVFAAVSHLMLIGTMVLNSFAAAITPRLSRFHAEGDGRRYYFEAALLIGAAALMSVSFMMVAYVGGAFIITLLYGEALSGYGPLVFAISLASFPMYVGSIMGFIPPALQAFRFHLVVNMLTVIGTTTAAFILIPLYGLNGAVYAIAVHGIIQFLNALILFRQPKPQAIEAKTDPSVAGTS